MISFLVAADRQELSIKFQESNGNYLPLCFGSLQVSLVNYTRNCYTKPLLVVNGVYPGPAIVVSEGDRVIVEVKNTGTANVTIHWYVQFKEFCCTTCLLRIS